MDVLQFPTLAWRPRLNLLQVEPVPTR